VPLNRQCRRHRNGHLLAAVLIVIGAFIHHVG
jgi:hypothetical protein